MSIAKKSVTVRIPNELYDMCNKNYDSTSNAVIAGLELLFVTNCNKDVITISELPAQIEEKEKIIKELQDQLKVKDDQIKVNDGNQNNRIEDLKNHIYLLDNQLRTKDDQIEKLNENMHKQAVHIQTLIQENSKLNTKLLPENVENKKPRWRFW